MQVHHPAPTGFQCVAIPRRRRRSSPDVSRTTASQASNALVDTTKQRVQRLPDLAAPCRACSPAEQSGPQRSRRGEQAAQGELADTRTFVPLEQLLERQERTAAVPDWRHFADAAETLAFELDEQICQDAVDREARQQPRKQPELDALLLLERRACSETTAAQAAGADLALLLTPGFQASISAMHETEAFLARVQRTSCTSAP
eukprot:jgi/Tetstr1/441877/TSEL_030087.t1